VIDYEALAGVCSVDGVVDVERFAAAVADAWLGDYHGSWPDRQILEVPQGTFTYLFDATSPPGPVDTRVIGVTGRAAPPIGPRDRSRMAGYPSPQRDSPDRVDRGHLVALSMGGGYDINLVPQLASVNRRGRWRAIERYCVARPGTFVLIHAAYNHGTDHPAWLEYGWLEDGELRVELFDNQASATG